MSTLHGLTVEDGLIDRFGQKLMQPRRGVLDVPKHILSRICADGTGWIGRDITGKTRLRRIHEAVSGRMRNDISDESERVELDDVDAADRREHCVKGSVVLQSQPR